MSALLKTADDMRDFSQFCKTFSSQIQTDAKKYDDNPLYRAHFTKTRDRIIEAASGLTGRALILGTGGAHDIPLRELAERFELDLADIDLEATARAVRELPPPLQSKCHLIHMDLTKIWRVFSERVGQLASAKAPASLFCSDPTTKVLIEKLASEKTPFSLIFSPFDSSSTRVSLFCQLPSVATLEELAHDDRLSASAAARDDLIDIPHILFAPLAYCTFLNTVKTEIDYPKNAASLVVSSLVSSQLSTYVRLYLDKVSEEKYGKPLGGAPDSILTRFEDACSNLPVEHIKDLASWVAPGGRVYFANDPVWRNMAHIHPDIYFREEDKDRARAGSHLITAEVHKLFNVAAETQQWKMCIPWGFGEEADDKGKIVITPYTEYDVTSMILTPKDS
jgi:hypothetical protein